MDVNLLGRNGRAHVLECYTGFGFGRLDAISILRAKANISQYEHTQSSAFGGSNRYSRMSPHFSAEACALEAAFHIRTAASFQPSDACQRSTMRCRNLVEDDLHPTPTCGKNNRHLNDTTTTAMKNSRCILLFAPTLH